MRTYTKEETMTPPSPSDDLVLPPGSRPPKAIPKCPACQQEFQEGQIIVHFVSAVAPGGLRTAPIHLGCAIALVQAMAEAASEAASEPEAESGG